MPITYILGLILAIAPFVTYGVMKADKAVAVAEAIRTERNAQITACNTKIMDLGSKLQFKQQLDAQSAETAAAAVTATPDDKGELAVLCKASASCRDKGATK